MEIPLEQAYIESLAKKNSFDYVLQQYNIQTGTCEEKSTLSGLPLSNIIKTLFLDNKEHYIGITLPATHTEPLVNILSKSLAISRKKAKQYRFSETLPVGMMKGTCTPFLYDDSSLDTLITYDTPIEGHADFSIGGTTPEYFTTSIQMKYAHALAIVKEQFPNMIITYTPQEKNLSQ